jgi:flavin reductase (DIM6/NTAB) family NADH-FMN oxidoreductase RutF
MGSASRSLRPRGCSLAVLGSAGPQDARMIFSPPAGARDAFKSAFMRFAATVSVVSYPGTDGAPAGMTATSICSLSLDPLSLLVCVNRENRSHAEITSAGVFGVNMLSVTQQNIAEHCSRPGVTKQIPAAWLSETDGNVPVIAGALAHLECALGQTLDVSTHSIFVGHVRSVRLGHDEHPLMYSNRAYRRFESGSDSDVMQRVWERVAFGALS